MTSQARPRPTHAEPHFERLPGTKPGPRSTTFVTLMISARLPSGRGPDGPAWTGLGHLLAGRRRSWPESWCRTTTGTGRPEGTTAPCAWRMFLGWWPGTWSTTASLPWKPHWHRADRGRRPAWPEGLPWRPAFFLQRPAASTTRPRPPTRGSRCWPSSPSMSVAAQHLAKSDRDTARDATVRSGRFFTWPRTEGGGCRLRPLCPGAGQAAPPWSRSPLCGPSAA